MKLVPRTVAAAISTALAAGLVATCASGAHPMAKAQDALAAPRVTVALSPGRRPVLTGAEDLGAGATTFIETTTAADADGSLIRLGPGVNPTRFAQRLTRAINDPDELESLLKDGSRILDDGGSHKGLPRTITLDLSPGTYLVVDTTDEKTVPTTPFTVDATPNGASPARPAAKVDLTDFSYTFTPSTLPRHGIVRFTNTGKVLHMAISYRVPSVTIADSIVKKLKTAKNPYKALGKYAADEGTGIGLISPGEHVDLTLHDRPGIYVMVSFWVSRATHEIPQFNLGMEKTFTVR